MSFKLTEHVIAPGAGEVLEMHGPTAGKITPGRLRSSLIQ
jgi:hypothetical protein